MNETTTLPRTYQCKFDPDDQLYVCRVLEYPGVTGHGESDVEAVRMANDNLRDYLNSDIGQDALRVEVPTNDWIAPVRELINAAELPSGGGCHMSRGDRDGEWKARDRRVWQRLDKAIKTARKVLPPPAKLAQPGDRVRVVIIPAREKNEWLLGKLGIVRSRKAFLQVAIDDYGTQFNGSPRMVQLDDNEVEVLD